MILGSNRKRAGATAVEFAVVAPVMFIVIFGIIELGRVLMIMHMLSDVARDATRYAVVTEGSNQSTSTIKSYVTTRLTAYGITSSVTPTISVSDSSSTDVSASTGPSQQTGSSNFGTYSVGSEVTVKVQVKVSDITWLPFADYVAGSTVLTGQYTLRRDPM
jgi:Flp pilus assembly protein TadG